MMRALISFVGLLACAAICGAQPAPAAPGTLPDPAAVAARGRELQTQRDALESGYTQQLKQCYQEFNVTGCRNAARERYVVAHRALTQRELEHTAQERALNAQNARQRLADKQQEAADKAREADKAQQAAVDRAERNANKQTDHAPEASKRSQFDEKQRDAQERRKDVEQRARDRERDKPRAAPLPSPASGAQP
jgi:hypothetical protein